MLGLRFQHASGEPLGGLKYGCSSLTPVCPLPLGDSMHSCDLMCLHADSPKDLSLFTVPCGASYPIAYWISPCSGLKLPQDELIISLPSNFFHIILFISINSSGTCHSKAQPGPLNGPSLSLTLHFVPWVQSTTVPCTHNVHSHAGYGLALLPVLALVQKILHRAASLIFLKCNSNHVPLFFKMLFLPQAL